MPYYRRRKRFYKKRPYRRGAIPGRKLQAVRKLAGQKPVTWAEAISKYAGPVGKIASTVSTIAALVNSESKCYDASLSGTIDNTPTYSICLSAIAQGDDVNQRNGRSVLMQNLQVAFVGIPTYTSPAIGSRDRMAYAIVLDKKAQIGAPVWTNLTGGSDPDSFFNDKDETDRFVVLKKGYILSGWGLESQQYRVYEYIDLKGIHCHFDGTTAADQDTNALYLIATHTGAESGVGVVGLSRLNFTDN